MGCRGRTHTLPVPSHPSPPRRREWQHALPLSRLHENNLPPPPSAPQKGARLRAGPTDNGNPSARGGERRARGRRAALPPPRRRRNSPSRLSDGGLHAAQRGRGAQFCPPTPGPLLPPAGHSPAPQRAPHWGET